MKMDQETAEFIAKIGNAITASVIALESAVRWLIVLAIMMALTVVVYLHFHVMAPMVKEITAGKAEELRFVASATPLLCSVREAYDIQDTIKELGETIKSLEGKKVEDCTKSFEAFLKCADELYNKGRKGIKLPKEIKNLLSRTVARAEAIEPYDKESEEFKNSLVSLLAYIDSTAFLYDVATDAIKDDKTVSIKLDQHGGLIAKNAGMWGEKVAEVWGEKIKNRFKNTDLRPFAILVSNSHNSSTKYLLRYFLYMFGEDLEISMMRSKAFREARTTGCLSKPNDIKAIRAVIENIMEE